MDHVKILAIDDNADNLIVLNALLGEAFPKAMFISALSGKIGLELCLSEKPDVILLDIVMPEMDGFEVCQILKADDRTKTIPVVIITAARTDKESRIKALEFGADAFLAKPLDESELVAQIRAMVRIKELEDLKLDEKERLKRLVEERTSQLEAELNERKRAEKALKQSEERFQLLFNEAPLGYQSLDFDGHFIEVNQQWLDTLGFTREEVVGKWFGDFPSPEYKDGFRQRFPLFKAQGHIHSEFEMVHKNGSRLFIAFEGKIGYNPDGGFKQTHCILQDITHRKLAEDALTESEEKYSILFKNSPDSYLIISDGIFVECNNATEMMLRGDRNQIIGQTPDAISPEIQPDGKKSSDSATEKITWTFENGKNTFEWMHRRFDGSDLYVEVSLATMMLKGKLTLFTTWRDISARKSAEQDLQESEAKFREFFEKAADAIFIAEIASGIIVDANEAACRLMQRSHDELVGIHQADLYPPIKENYAKDTFKKHKELVKQKLSSHAIENTVVRADGTEIPVEILASEVDYHGKSCMMGTFRDISERKKSEKEILESETKYRYMFQNNPQPMWIYDHDTLEILEVNEVSTKIYGYSREEFLTMTIKDISPAEDIPLMLEDVEVSRLDENSLGEWRHLKKSGEIMNVEISASSIVFNGRKARHVLIKDITERKRAEEALRKSESMLRTLIESAPFEIWARDKDGVGILENENHVRHFGSIIGKTPDHQGISHQVRQLWDSNNRRVMNGQIVDDECVYLVDGVERHFHQILAPIIIDGSMEGVTGFNIDITERKLSELKLIAAKEKAEESDRLKSAFLANMSHEIRTPLNSIIGFSELLFDPDFDADRQIEFAQMINTSGTNLLTIITDIMDLSKIEAGQIQVNKARFMVNKLISDIQKEYSYKAYEKGIDLRLDPASPAIETYLESDQYRIKQVLVNFVGNSIKFTAKGSIEIGFAIVEGFIQFHVIDTGIGIPKDFHESVFERFRQVDSSSNRKYGGNGLGLAISKSLVEMLDGRIWMESESGKGSVFYFTIPVQTPEVT